jgi:rod shape-determining protein MreD
MGSFLSIPILALAAALQASVIPQIQILGGRPDLVFLLVLSWAINSDLDEALGWAFAGGIMQDLLSATPLGTSSLGMVLLVFAISGINRQVYRVGILLLGGVTLGGTLLQQIVLMAVLLLTGHRITLPEIGYVVLPTMVYNLVAMGPIYWLVRRVQRRLKVGDRVFT